MSKLVLQPKISTNRPEGEVAVMEGVDVKVEVEVEVGVGVNVAVEVEMNVEVTVSIEVNDGVWTKVGEGE